MGLYFEALFTFAAAFLATDFFGAFFVGAMAAGTNFSTCFLSRAGMFPVRKIPSIKALEYHT
jgi:hypothetical protein